MNLQHLIKISFFFLPVSCYSKHILLFHWPHSRWKMCVSLINSLLFFSVCYHYCSVCKQHASNVGTKHFIHVSRVVMEFHRLNTRQHLLNSKTTVEHPWQSIPLAALSTSASGIETGRNVTALTFDVANVSTHILLLVKLCILAKMEGNTDRDPEI